MRDVGIAAFGAYIPPLRVSREEIAATHEWLNPGLRALAHSERSACGWDEDVVTMAVDAARDCLIGENRSSIGRLCLGTTTAPFADRLNAGIVAGALGLPDTVQAQDVTGSQRAGTSALLTGIDSAAARDSASLCIASERRSAPAATAQEMVAGHAAAAVVVAPGAGVARLLGSTSLTLDFVDHYRAAGQRFDYSWEERWVRDAGYLVIVPRLVSTLLERSGLAPADITHLCFPASPRVGRAVAKACGIGEGAVRDSLADGCGDSGAAHAMLMLVEALEGAGPGDRILVIGFGQGGDALLFEVTGAIGRARARGTGVRRSLRNRSQCTYARFATLSGLLTVDRGIRAEADKGTAHSAAWRHADFLTGLIGGRCRVCTTHQIPRNRMCVDPQCHAIDSQDAYSFAESRGTVVSWSSDRLTFTPDPPARYGMIDFDEGGRLMMDFTGVDDDGVAVGVPMRMVFRIKDHDTLRGFTRYFWKAAPAHPTEV